MTSSERILVNVDVTNPGQFFACCGLLEMADRLWPGAEGWFADGLFALRTISDLTTLIHAIATANLVQLDADNSTSSPIEIGLPFRALRLDWWHDDRSGGKELKVWAGTMESARIARAMQYAMREERFCSPDCFNIGMVVYDPDDAEKKVEPYYFDARRGPNAHSRDVGFSPNDLQLTTTAFPAVEFLCLVGLQRCLPIKTSRPRIYDYFTWGHPIIAPLLRPVVAGQVEAMVTGRYRFENWYGLDRESTRHFVRQFQFLEETIDVRFSAIRPLSK